MDDSIEKVINHDEAHELALLNQKSSNIARCYIALRQQVEELRKEIKAEKLIWFTEKDQMQTNFDQCKIAAEHWKARAEAAQKETSTLKEYISQRAFDNKVNEARPKMRKGV
jgi:hypothetical protein